MALGCAILLLLPGGCFLFVGLGSGDPHGLMIGALILVISGVLFWAALSRPSGAVSPPTEPDNRNDP